MSDKYNIPVEQPATKIKTEEQIKKTINPPTKIQNHLLLKNSF